MALLVPAFALAMAGPASATPEICDDICVLQQNQDMLDPDRSREVMEISIVTDDLEPYVKCGILSMKESSAGLRVFEQSGSFEIVDRLLRKAYSDCGVDRDALDRAVIGRNLLRGLTTNKAAIAQNIAETRALMFVFAAMNHLATEPGEEVLAERYFSARFPQLHQAVLADVSGSGNAAIDPTGQKESQTHAQD
ncbi:MAG: hypothetical protein ACK5NN_08635 [Sphingomonadaceae bacterium]